MRSSKIGKMTRAAVSLIVFAVGIGPISACAASARSSETNWVKQRARQAISVERALESPDISEADKEKLRLVQEMRQFAETRLHLDRTANYTTYLPGDPDEVPMWVLIVASRQLFAPVVWRYDDKDVPYQTFAVRDEAEALAADYRARGYETYVRPAHGYSSQGAVKDPIMSFMLRLTADQLTSLIVHELTHSTVAANSSPYEEGCATFVGLRGAKEFLDYRFGLNNAHSRRLMDTAADRQAFEEFLRDTAGRLVKLHGQKTSDLQEKRVQLFADARRRYDALRPQMRTSGYQNASLDQLNAAMLLAFLNYADTKPFADAFAATGENWPKFIEIAQQASQHAEPFSELRRLMRPPDR